MGVSPATDELQSIQVALRFERSQMGPLMIVADALRAFPDKDDIRLMLMAHEAARTGEPLILTCADIDEANRIANVFSDHGLRRPAVEELSGE